ncbi:MAG TPA: hypothetical protein VK196_18195 [Magnetospirillum sp.]|nr:hypothetical protein [Magnetospirillum sp.]
MRLFFAKPGMENHEIIAEAILATETYVGTWQAPRGMIGYLRDFHRVQRPDANLFLLVYYARTIIFTNDVPILVQDDDTETLTYLGLLRDEGIRLWHEAIDLGLFMDEIAKTVLAKEVVSLTEQMKSAMTILVREWDCDSLEQCEELASSSKNKWPPPWQIN